MLLIFFIIIISFPFFLFCWYRSLERERDKEREEGRKRRRQRRRWKKKEKMKGVKTVRKNKQRQCWGGCISSWWYHSGVWPLSQDVLPFLRLELSITLRKKSNWVYSLFDSIQGTILVLSFPSWIFLSCAKSHYPVTVSPRLVWMWSLFIPLLCWIENS